MVADPNSAIITAFPAQDGEGESRFLRQLARLCDAGGTVTIQQAQLAASLGVHVRTIGRWTASSRRKGLITTQGRGDVLTYGLLVWPDAGAPAPLRMSDLSDPIRSPVSEGSDIGTSERARGSLSSSSSSALGHPISGTLLSDPPDLGHGDGEPPREPPRLTARGELLALYDVQPTAEMASEWGELDDVARALVDSQARMYPATRDPHNPEWFGKLVHTAFERMQGRRLAATLQLPRAETPQEPPHAAHGPSVHARPAPRVVTMQRIARAFLFAFLRAWLR